MITGPDESRLLTLIVHEAAEREDLTVTDWCDKHHIRNSTVYLRRQYGLTTYTLRNVLAVCGVKVSEFYRRLEDEDAKKAMDGKR